MNIRSVFTVLVALSGPLASMAAQGASVAVGRDQSQEFNDPNIVRVEVLDSENNPGGDPAALVTAFDGQNACLVYVYDDDLTLDQDVRLALFDANDNVLGLPIVNVTNTYHNTVDPTCGAVSVPNNPPVAADDAFGTNYEGQNVLANDSDPDGDALSAQLISGPQNGTVSLSSNGSFSYTPNPGFAGGDSFSYRVSDGQLVSNVATVSLEVVPDNQAPVAVNDSFGPEFGGANVLSNDSDPDGDSLTAVLESGPANGSLQLNADGSFSYTPDTGFTGEDSFVYRAFDGELESNAATVTLSVAAAGGPPVAMDDELGADWRNANLLDNDQFANLAEIEILLVAGPEGGSLAINPDGTFEYRPFAGYVGADSFTYQLRSAGGEESGVATVSLTVDGEEAGEEGVTGKEDADGTSVLANASPNELRLSRRIDAICNRIDPENEDQADLLNLCTNLRAQGTTAQQALNALRALTPEELAVIGKSIRVLSFSRFRSIGARMARVREGGTKGLSLAGLNLNYGDSMVSGDQLDKVLQEALGALGTGASGDGELLEGSRAGLWLRGDLSFGEQDRTELESGYDFDAQILTAGLDYRINNNLFVGASLSVGQVEVEFAERGGDTNSDTYALALYGSVYRGNSYLDGVVSYGWSDVDTRRNILYDDFGGRVERRASGSTDGNEYYLSLNVGHSFDVKGFKLDPLVRFFYLDGDVDAFTESGAQGLNLQVDDQGFESMSLTASGQLSYTFLPSWGVVTPYVRLEYTYEFEDSADGVRYRFANDPFADRSAENSLRIDVDDPDTSYMVYSTGVAAQFAHGISGFVAYQTLGGYTDLDAEIVSVGVRWELAL